MTTDDTQPSLPLRHNDELVPPPKLLFYGVITLSLSSIIMPIIGVVMFRDMLRPSQQQRIINNLPFMANFLPYRPDVDETVPTPISVEGNLSTNELLITSTESKMPTATLIPTTNEIEPVLSTTAVASTTHLAEQIQPALTLLPTFTATPARSLEPSETLSTQTLLSSRLYGFRFEQQTWNNCGPASITIALSYFGWQEDQEYARQILRPDREDKNVTPDEMVSFVNQNTGIKALWRNGGTIEVLRELIANEFPVILGTGFMPEAYDWIGHYRAVVAYDSAYFYFYDSFMGTGLDNQGYALSVDEVDQNWQHFNRRFIVLYSPDREQDLMAILDTRTTINRANELALATAQQEARTNPQNAYAWFNMGTSLTHLHRFEEAAIAFDRARQTDLPWRMLWYQFEPYQSYYETGRYDDVLALVQSNLNNGGKYVEETFYWQGMVYEAQNQRNQARLSYEQALRLNPNFTQAEEAISRFNSTN